MTSAAATAGLSVLITLQQLRLSSVEGLAKEDTSLAAAD
jgi:hypothetical protein